MGTTINDVDRCGEARSTEDYEKLLENARKILADTSAYLESRVKELQKMEAGAESPEDRKKLEGLIQQTSAAWRQVLDMQAKAGRTSPAHPTMDLEAAREEILGRLARLAE